MTMSEIEKPQTTMPAISTPHKKCFPQYVQATVRATALCRLLHSLRQLQVGGIQQTLRICFCSGKFREIGARAASTSRTSPVAMRVEMDPSFRIKKVMATTKRNGKKRRTSTKAQPESMARRMCHHGRSNNTETNSAMASRKNNADNIVLNRCKTLERVERPERVLVLLHLSYV